MTTHGKCLPGLLLQGGDNELVDKIDRLLTSHGLRTITGKSVGGGALTPEVRARIEQADALVALLTRREQTPSSGWTTSEWVKDELDHARAKGKPSIAVIEGGVAAGGAYRENEYIPLDRAFSLETFLRLSETIQVWKERVVRTVAVRLSMALSSIASASSFFSSAFSSSRVVRRRASETSIPMGEPTS
jgi:hypothetical protein